MTLPPPRPRHGLQVIPRPPAHRPGGPAPWAGVAAEDRRAITLDRVRSVVAARSSAGSAPVGAGDRRLAEFIRSFDGVDVGVRPAAVLVALFDEDDRARVLLTVRSGELRSHRGEVAFPGGRLDEGETVEEAALREAFEEVGLDPATVAVVGHLSAMPTVSSNTLMTPVVGTLPGRPATVASPAEVARIFDVALSELVEDGAFREEWWAVPGRPGADGTLGGEFPVWFFTAGGEIIWGATARVLTELLCLVLGVAVPGIRPVG